MTPSLRQLIMRIGEEERKSGCQELKLSAAVVICSGDRRKGSELLLVGMATRGHQSAGRAYLLLCSGTFSV